MEFTPFPSISRLSRDIVITEKLDGTNAQVCIYKDYKNVSDELGPLSIIAGSRSRWIMPEEDNFGFAKWVRDNKEELLKLGEGSHFGEWWGKGIQTGYGLNEKRFSLFNTHKWSEDATRPKCCHVVPILYSGEFDTMKINQTLERLDVFGSVASPGFMKPEGIVIYHKHSNTLFKKTIKNDDKGKSYGF